MNSTRKSIVVFSIGALVVFGTYFLKPNLFSPILPTLPSEAQATVGELDISGTSVSFTKMYDNANSSYFIDPAASDISLTVLGKAGIGTTNPGQKLTLDGTAPVAEIRSGGYLMLRNTANDWDMRLQSFAVQKLGLYSGGDLANPIATFVHGGNVGIGTTSPGAKLDVAGNIYVSEMAEPSTPPSGKVAIYAKSDNGLYIKDDAGNETKLGGGAVGITLRQKYEWSGSGASSVQWSFNHQGGTIAVGWCNGGDHYFFQNLGSTVTFAGTGLSMLKRQVFFTNSSGDRPRICEWWWNTDIAAQQANVVVTFTTNHLGEFWGHSLTLSSVSSYGNSGGGVRDDDAGAGNLTYTVSGQSAGNLVLSIVSNQKAGWSETSGATLIEKDGTMGGSGSDAGLYSRTGTGDQTFTYYYDSGPEAASAAIEFVP